MQHRSEPRRYSRGIARAPLRTGICRRGLEFSDEAGVRRGDSERARRPAKVGTVGVECADPDGNRVFSAARFPATRSPRCARKASSPPDRAARRPARPRPTSRRRGSWRNSGSTAGLAGHRKIAGLNVDLIFTIGPGVLAARSVTTTLPIVALVWGDFVAAGLAESLSH